MLRLKAEWIRDIKNNLSNNENALIKKTGCTLKELSALANDITVSKIDEAATDFRVAIIPVTAGQGIMPFFAESVASIINHLGFNTFITEGKDVEGIYEAYQEEATCIFLADDNRFVGINTQNGLYTDSMMATAKGYITAIEQACGNLQAKEVLILGYGNLGRILFSRLEQKGALPMVYDKEPSVLTGLDKRIVVTSLDQISNYTLIFDATDEGNWMSEEMISKAVFIASPGITLGIADQL